MTHRISENGEMIPMERRRYVKENDEIWFGEPGSYPASTPHGDTVS